MSEDYLWFEGIAFPKRSYKPERIREVRDEFVMKDDDVVIVTYPKSGTNWLIEIVCLILSKGDPKWNQSVPTWERSPWIETVHAHKFIDNMKDPRLFSSHLPFQLFPKSIVGSKAKVIYLIRNPRDVIVSGYHFLNSEFFIEKPKSLQQYFECFIQGNVIYGSWFDHVHGWIPMREKGNFLMLSYEELSKDKRSTVEKICQFLEKKLEPEELDLVLKNSTFKAMEDNNRSNFSLLNETAFSSIPSIMRKGICGDWKNVLTVAQAEVFDKIFQEKMADLPRELFPWQ
ncbi:PREDICTED: bile salt sulfotransferase [Galeopterus variegatus]|uniref:Sulfotransferase n=1 Tax=Galeopterus variegatus TaxID=482537 RepID=A0ABM0SBK4_GALVR|nr:PREDICTED: bile salt sulfotransferase [Galeopterus variegatus]